MGRNMRELVKLVNTPLLLTLHWRAQANGKLMKILKKKNLKKSRWKMLKLKMEMVKRKRRKRKRRIKIMILQWTLLWILQWILHWILQLEKRKRKRRKLNKRISFIFLYAIFSLHIVLCFACEHTLYLYNIIEYINHYSFFYKITFCYII